MSFKDPRTPWQQFSSVLHVFQWQPNPELRKRVRALSKTDQELLLAITKTAMVLRLEFPLEACRGFIETGLKCMEKGEGEGMRQWVQGADLSVLFEE